ncbi:MAG TPA: KTSC domain-containing protein [Methanoregulaceae archaeon]|nr:KTSC domain-containing protein [Methanoregulaceae archaeon]
MNMVWDKKKSHGIRRLGYDMGTHTMTIEFTGKPRISHSPVPYAVYESINNSTFPEKLYRRIILGKIPIVAR